MIFLFSLISFFDPDFGDPDFQSNTTQSFAAVGLRVTMLHTVIFSISLIFS